MRFDVSSDGRSIACVGYNNDGTSGHSVEAIDIEKKDVRHFAPVSLREGLRSSQSPFNPLVFSPDGVLLALAGSDGSVTVWDWETKNQKHSFEFFKADAKDVDFSPDGRYLAVVGCGGRVKVWDVVTGKKKATFSARSWYSYTVAFSPDGIHLVWTGEHCRLTVMNLTTKAELYSYRIPSFQMDDFADMCVSLDGRHIAIAGIHKSKTKVFDFNTGRELFTFRGWANVRGLFSGRPLYRHRVGSWSFDLVSERKTLCRSGSRRHELASLGSFFPEQSTSGDN
jgi:WD40 repeat protein